MSELVPREDIVNHVGRERHPNDHYGRWNTNEGRIYILHSYECVTKGEDLRQCEYSLALDKGPRRFEGHKDTPVKLAINSNGRLIPA